MIDIICKFILEAFKDETFKDVLYGMANSLTIIVGLCTIVIQIINKIIFVYKLKHFSIFNRPDWLSEQEFYNHTYNYIKTKVQDFKGKKYSFNTFIQKNIIKGKKQYHLILGEAGTGKSTFLVNLYVRINCKVFRKGYTAKCISLRMHDAIDRINKITNQKEVVLLLDSFDESHDANVDPDNFLKKIEESTKNFAKVVIASRNNFFDNDESIPVNVDIKRVLSYYNEFYDRYYILPFTNLDVFSYILKKYKFLLNKIIKSLKLIRKCKKVIYRPLILSYIDLLIKDKFIPKDLCEIYNHIIKNWVKRESYFVKTKNEGIDISLIEKQMNEFLNDIAIYMYECYPIQNEYYILIKDLYKIKQGYYIRYTDGKRNRSLFDRVDDKLFFVHKSLLEYLLAINFDKLNFRYEKNLNFLYDFLKEIAGKDWNSKYKALFHLHYQDEFTRNISSNNDDVLVFESSFLFNNREYVYDMICWYCDAIFFPVFINSKTYRRLKITINVNDIICYNITPYNSNPIQASENVMYIVKHAMEQKKVLNIIIKSYLKEF